ncbi:hypothetical protein [Zhongshania borealis]|uniref:DUF3592 domain-containing protein n=1 Tax=Zhongshania borealis TaxID=889488 RepID=A0ABP7WNT0_9GAMM
MNFDSFWADIAATLLGGVGLTFLFFVAREKLFSVPEITGRWYMEMVKVNTAYNPYKDMTLRYVIMIWREGNTLKGTAEKIYENSSTGEREFVGKNRTRAIIEGYIEKTTLARIGYIFTLSRMDMVVNPRISMIYWLNLSQK